MGFDADGALSIDEDMSYEAYLMGAGAYRGTGEKTPEWASAMRAQCVCMGGFYL